MQWERPQSLFARCALTDSGWQKDVLIAIDADGRIKSITPGSKPPAGVSGFDLLLPGMANVHSHSFQRAMAGFTEVASGKGHDNFWSWRRVMYAFTRQLTPQQVETISRALYIELLKHGYTGVGEFHYLHHDTNGKPYATTTELSQRVIAAATDAGIQLTHLPVMYESGNFGGEPANSGQARFLHSADSYVKLLDALRTPCAEAGFTLGIAPHSLRAVTPQSLKAITSALPALGLGDCPIHMHISEQEKEVDDCLAWSKKRPVEWLFGNADIGKRWCLIHATHITPEETGMIARSGAVAGLCPTTESNLGDGIFPTEQYVKEGGRFAIGGDSHVCVSPWEELRQLEYAQRLCLRKRAVLHTAETASVGRTLFERAAAGGAQAMGVAGGRIAKDLRADMVALSLDDPFLADKQDDQLLDALIFTGTRPRMTHVWVGGNQVVTNGFHVLEESTRRAMYDVMHTLSSQPWEA